MSCNQQVQVVRCEERITIKTAAARNSGSCFTYVCLISARGGGGGNSNMKRAGMLVGNFELNPRRRPIWAWPKHFLTPERDHVKTQTNEKHSDF